MQTLLREVCASYPFHFRKNPVNADSEKNKTVADNG